MASIYPSSFAQTAIRIPIAGEIIQMGYNGRAYLPPIYNDNSKHILLKFGRQTEKSTTIGNIALVQTTLVPGFRTLVVHPSAQQSKTFSEDRIRLPLRVSPHLRQFYPKNSQSIFHKKTIVDSSILLRYAFLSAGRIRGIPADMLIIDEFQDILEDLVPVIEQVCFHSNYRYYIYSGTPLTEENIIERYWRNSTMNEWVVPCRKHGTPKDPGSWHWNVLGMKNIGKKGLICEKCGGPISAQDPDCRWAALQNPKGDNINWRGYHASQLIMHFINEQEHWNEILRKLHDYSKPEFMNEVLGESCARAEVPMTKDEVIGICQDNIKFSLLEELIDNCGGRVYLGIDWGTGEADSYTCLVVGGYLKGSRIFQILFTYRFEGQETEYHIYMEKIQELIDVFNLRHIGVDYGNGEIQNNHLLREYGLERVHRYQYGGRQRSGKIVHNEAMGRYMLGRSEIITDVISAMKHHQVLLPNKQDLIQADLLSDFCAQRAVYNRTTQYMKFDRVAGRPDDAFHATIYCLLASMFDIPRPDIITPRPEFEKGETLDLLNTFDADDGILPGMIYA